ncbi:MAG TPA: prepilin-type N-terminal cleavage/methylation domain-containing protein [Solirubrobacteraceae bacterium]|nr:prepilin-type N-terminal cleavage/methylation domain-containing protein [Solirubrobacteraceae bacterium]
MTASPASTHTRRTALLGQAGYTLIELLVAMAIGLVILTAVLTALLTVTNNQSQDAAYAEQISSTQTTFWRLLHDLRQATAFVSLTPNSVVFQMVISGTTYNVFYNCAAIDSLGSPYTRCARTQALAPALPAAAGSAAGSTDIQHVANGSIATFCTTDGSAQSGSVFFPSNANVPDTDGSTAACDEAYERELASLSGGPDYMQVKVKVPISGGLKSSALTGKSVLQSGVFLPNLDVGNS